MFPPSRIVCLTEETVETLYLLGEQDRIVGISGYVVRPPQARREKPRVSAFTSANIDKILALQPDLVLTFSNLQAAGSSSALASDGWQRSSRLWVFRSNAAANARASTSGSCASCGPSAAARIRASSSIS